MKIFKTFFIFIFFCLVFPVVVHASENNFNFTQLPVNGELIVGFSASTQYGSGVRAIKFNSYSPSVKAVMSGKVVFVGNVKGIKYITILHTIGDQSYRTTYGSMVSTDVVVGEKIVAGEAIGTTFVNNSFNKHLYFTFSLKKYSNGTWVFLDPMRYYSNEKNDVIIPSEKNSDFAYFSKVVHEFNLTFLKELFYFQIQMIKNSAVGNAYYEIMQLVSIYQNLKSCQVKISYRKSKNIVIFVPGINTFFDKHNAPVDIDYKQIGFEKSNVYYFSYGNKNLNQYYLIKDSYGDMKNFAKQLLVQLESLNLDGKIKVDLVAHSQGGVVVKEFLSQYYENSKLKNMIDHVVLFSSPQQGTPLADLRKDYKYKKILDNIPLDILDSKSIDQMTQKYSYINNNKLPKEIKYLSIGSNFDVVVPASSTKIKTDGVNKSIEVNAGILNGHSEIKNDQYALKYALSFLTDQKPPCLSAIDAGSSLIFPSIIRYLP